MISVIIPTKNEERYLPLLLDSLKSQNFNDTEIIIADAGSTDRTREIAKNYGCRIVEGGLPAKGRNNGARESNGELLMFVDADVILPRGFLKNAVSEFYARGLDVAGTLQNPIMEKFNLNHKVIYETINQYMILTERMKPHMQVCAIVKKSIHERVHGFDERIVYGEDSNYVERAGKVGKFGVLRSGRVWISPRRFEKDRMLALKCLYFNAVRSWGREFYEGKTRLRYFK